MAARYAAETPVLDWRERLVCSALRQPAGRYGGERDRPAVAPPHTVARTRAETPDAHCAFGEAIARYRASNAANEQHHHGPDDHYKRSGASPGPKAGGPVFRVM
jgi:hypothetical protein